MTRVYRILRRPYSRTPFDGEGAYRYGGRWSSPGTRLSYTSEHESLAMLEYFVHLDADDPPPDLVLAMCRIPDDLPREKIGPSELPPTWRETPAPLELAGLGDRFLQRGDNLLLLVPSVLAPSEYNWLINPQHRDFGKVAIEGTQPLNYDVRLFRRGRRRPRGKSK